MVVPGQSDHFLQEVARILGGSRRDLPGSSKAELTLQDLLNSKSKLYGKRISPKPFWCGCIKYSELLFNSIWDS